jgi:hypothetical protein
MALYIERQKQKNNEDCIKSKAKKTMFNSFSRTVDPSLSDCLALA